MARKSRIARQGRRQFAACSISVRAACATCSARLRLTSPGWILPTVEASAEIRPAEASRSETPASSSAAAALTRSAARARSGQARLPSNSSPRRRTVRCSGVLRALLEKVDILAVLGVVSQGEVAADELHIAFLPGAVVVEDHLVVPVVLVAELSPLLACHDDDERHLARCQDAALPLQLGRAVPLMVDAGANVDVSWFEHSALSDGRCRRAAARQGR